MMASNLVFEGKKYPSDIPDIARNASKCRNGQKPGLILSAHKHSSRFVMLSFAFDLDRNAIDLVSSLD
jgi:hypothetical protein